VSSPTGISGWVDASSNVWHLDDSQDDTIDLAEGENILTAYVVRQDYSLWYTLS
jgi:hypothetical protein